MVTVKLTKIQRRQRFCEIMKQVREVRDSMSNIEYFNFCHDLTSAIEQEGREGLDKAVKNDGHLITEYD